MVLKTQENIFLVIFKMKDRKYQFLESVNNIYRRTKKPVHYSGVADFLGVSLSTAYNILLELSSRGLLKKIYEPDGKKGRAKILFVPTEDGTLTASRENGGNLMDCILACHFAIMTAVMKAPEILSSTRCCKDSSKSVVVGLMTGIWDKIIENISSDQTSMEYLDRISGTKKQFLKSVSKLSDIEIKSLCRALTSFFFMANSLIIMGRG